MHDHCPELQSKQGGSKGRSHRLNNLLEVISKLGLEDKETDNKNVTTVVHQADALEDSREQNDKP